MSNSVRCAVIGAGYIAGYHARGIVEADATELRYVVSRSSSSGEELVSQLAAGEPTTDLERVLGDPEVDAVIIATPNSLHESQSVAALEAGKAVLVDKPMAATLEAAERMAESARQNGACLQVGHMWRYDTEVRRIRTETASGRIGRVYRTVSYGAHERWGPGGWFTEAELAGGGALLDMGVHAIDTSRYLLGDPAPVSVYARISSEHGLHKLDDTGLIVITWENGVVSTVESGWWQPKVAGPEAATRLYGTAGYASLFPTYWESIDLEAPRGQDGAYPEPTVTTPDFPLRREHCDQRMYTAQISTFARQVEAHREKGDRAETEVPPWEPGLVVMRIVDAAYRSASADMAVPCERRP